MVNFIEVQPQRVGLAHNSDILLVLRDGRTGEMRDFRRIQNMKVYGTVNMLISGVTNSTQAGSAVYAGLGSGPSVASADTTLSGELLSRTVGRLSHDANSPTWSLSFSWTDSASSVSIGQVGLFTSYTGGLLYLKASFARLTKNSQDVLNIAWTQSLASA